MCMTLKLKFITLWQKYLNDAELPIVFYTESWKKVQKRIGPQQSPE